MKMSILIDRQETIKEFCKQDCDCDPKDCYVGTCYEVEIIESVPPAQPRKGKWIRTRTLMHDGELYCDQCGQEHPEQKKIWNFCPNCGADMRGNQE